MQASLTILPLLAAILIGAKLAGRLSQRVGLPAVFGELLLGIVLGPSLLNLIHSNETLIVLGQIGVIVLMFRAGLETDMVQMRQVGGVAMLAACGGVIVPFVGGYLLARAFGESLLPALFVGAVLTATSVSISAEVLRELGKLRARAGATIMGAAVIDDVLGVLVLSVVLGLAGTGDPLITFAKMALFFPVAWLIGDRLIPWLVRFEHQAGGKEAVLAIGIGLVLLYAWSAEALGSVAAITGAYLLGIVVARHTNEAHAIYDGTASLGYAFLVPIFFVNIGLEANISTLGSSPVFTACLLLIACGGKIFGSGLGALVGRLTQRESLQVGIGMIARGEVALVMVAAGRSAGLVDANLFTATIIMTLITTLITPPLLRMAFMAPKVPQVAERPTLIEATE